jgi:hypothetical protein
LVVFLWEEMMDKEQIIEWARTAGATFDMNGENHCFETKEGLVDFAKLVAKHAIAKDREAVALLIEKRGAQGYGTLAIAAEVRADNACSTLCHPEEPCFITEDGMCAKRGSHGEA